LWQIPLHGHAWCPPRATVHHRRETLPALHHTLHPRCTLKAKARAGHRGCLSMRHAADEAQLMRRMHGRACCKCLHSNNQCIFDGLHACSRVQRQCVTEAPSGRTHPLVSSLCFHLTTCLASAARRTSPTASTSPHSLPVSCTRAASTARARSGASMTCQTTASSGESATVLRLLLAHPVSVACVYRLSDKGEGAWHVHACSRSSDPVMPTRLSAGTAARMSA